MMCRSLSGWAAALLLMVPGQADGGEPFDQVRCEGTYDGHLQGICTDGTDSIWWSFTTHLVRTDRTGRVLASRTVKNHHGDLCFHEGRVYVAVNYGRFNDPQKRADSWVNVYDPQTLEETARHPVPEVVYGAGGMDARDGRFFVVGGLPADHPENYVYEYDSDFTFVRRHTIDSGWTFLGIQTAAFHDGSWWFGCYGRPAVLLKTDSDFRMQGRWEFDCSLGIVGNGPGRLLAARGKRTAAGRHSGLVIPVRPDSEHGLVEIRSLEK